MKISSRLKTICDLIPSNSNVIDVGCDHAFLDIYLTLNKNCNCIASDVNDNVLKISKDNINKYNLNDKIKLVKSYGIDDIDVVGNEYIVIAGMGTNTILSILKNIKFNKNDNLIIQTNNDLYLFRKTIIKMGYYIEDEKIVLENKKYYVIIYLKKGNKKYNKYEYLFGPIILNKDIELKKEYLSYLYSKYNNIYNSLPDNKIMKKFKINKIKKKLINYI